MTVLTLPDIEGGVREWLRSVPEIIALVGNRVFLGLPDTMAVASFPCIALHKPGLGSIAPGGVPVSTELLQFDCWAQNKDKKQAVALSLVLMGALAAMPAGTPFGPNTISLGASIYNAPIWSPDPDTAQARYVAQAFVTARTTQAA